MYKQTPGCGSTGQRKVTVCAHIMRVLSNSEKSYLPLLGQTQDKNWRNCTQVGSLIIYISFCLLWYFVELGLYGILSYILGTFHLYHFFLGFIFLKEYFS